MKAWPLLAALISSHLTGRFICILALSPHCVGFWCRLTSIPLGLIAPLQGGTGLRVHFLKPISPAAYRVTTGRKRSSEPHQPATGLTPPTPDPSGKLSTGLANGNWMKLLEEYVSLYQQTPSTPMLVIVEGMVPT